MQKQVNFKKSEKEYTVRSLILKNNTVKLPSFRALKLAVHRNFFSLKFQTDCSLFVAGQTKNSKESCIKFSLDKNMFKQSLSRS